jgi:sterol desaturase/sphingolipid hydroxylase (fatty acid hydroxylase superfamily)
MAGWLPGVLVLGGFAALVVLERWRPLRRRVEQRDTHDLRNLAMAATAAVAVRIADRPITGRLAELVERRRWGLLQWRPLGRSLPPPVETALALALMDYTLYLWHVLLHRVPLLWRCHLVHHVDLDLSASTAFRFHFAEMVLSVPWRAAQIVLIGVRPPVLKAWQTATLVEVLFQHADLRLPPRIERALRWLVVTPRLHGIHHSSVREETASNWSSGLTVWDRLHGTLRVDVPQRAIAIGTAGYRDPGELGLPALLAMPFGEQRPAWMPPGGHPVAQHPPVAQRLSSG